MKQIVHMPKPIVLAVCAALGVRPPHALVTIIEGDRHYSFTVEVRP